MSVGLVRKWTDTGAPTLNVTPGSLGDLLEAVLVDGYGAFDPLGWTKPYEATSGYINVFRNSEINGTGHFFQFAENVGTVGAAFIEGYEQMSDENTGILPIHSEELIASSQYHWLQYGPTSDQGALEWIIIGDDLGFYLCLRPWAYLSTSQATYLWTVTFFGDYVAYDEANKWNSCIICPVRNTAPGISTNLQVGSLSGSPTGSLACYRVARDRNNHNGSISADLVMAYSLPGTNYLGAFSDTTYFNKEEDVIQSVIPAYLKDPQYGILGRPPGFGAAGTMQGIDGVAMTVSNQYLKVYKEYDMGDSKDHFFPYITSSQSWPGTMVIQSGEGFRNAFA